MPDLAAHVLAIYPIKLKIKKFLSPLLVGTILPDILGRISMIIFPNSYSIYWIGKALHAPLTLFFTCLLLTFFFEEKERRRVFPLLCLGVFSHLLLDSFQKSLIRGYLWFFPISFKSFSFNLFWPDEALIFIPILVIINLIIQVRRAKRTQSSIVSGRR